MITISTVERACDCCHSTELEPIWTYSFAARTRSNVFIWNVRNVVCRRCGFAFVAPAPHEAELERYYGDSLSRYAGQAVAYSIDTRLRLIEKHLAERNSGTYIELGSNNSPRFMSSLSDLFERIITVEPNASCDSSYDSLHDVPPGTGDIITAYFVLEHIPNLKSYLSGLYRSLANGGMLILEVPDLDLYPANPAGLFLFEHVNHFSPRSLARLAACCGLDLVETRRDLCSRPSGFAAVFSKGQPGQVNTAPDPDEVSRALAGMRGGYQTIQRFQARLESARAAIQTAADTGKTIVIWAANWISARLIDGFDLPDSVVVVDSDPRKRDFLHPRPVHQPEALVDTLKRAGLLVINTNFHADDILHWIEEKTGRRFAPEQTIILDI